MYLVTSFTFARQEQWRRDAARANQKIDENSLKDLLVGEIHKGVELAENQLYAKFDVEQRQVEASCNAYQSNGAVKKYAYISYPFCSSPRSPCITLV